MTAAGAGAWRGETPVLLASGSATRRGLLERAGIAVEAVAADLDERALAASWGDLPPGEVASRLAAAKAEAVAAGHPGRVVIGADQVLSCEGVLFSKARDREDARQILLRLSGRTHRLHSAVALLQDGEPVGSFVSTADLTMRDLGPAAIDAYLRLAGPAATRSVGCYEVEGLGIHLFDRIEGEHSTILGLPLLPLLAAFRRLGLVAP